MLSATMLGFVILMLNIVTPYVIIVSFTKLDVVMHPFNILILVTLSFIFAECHYSKY
jgi:hypothetical protein